MSECTLVPDWNNTTKIKNRAAISCKIMITVNISDSSTYSMPYGICITVHCILP